MAPDPFIVVAAGRSLFHIANLAELADLVAGLTGDSSPIVKEITP